MLNGLGRCHYLRQEGAIQIRRGHKVQCKELGGGAKLQCKPFEGGGQNFSAEASTGSPEATRKYPKNVCLRSCGGYDSLLCHYISCHTCFPRILFYIMYFHKERYDSSQYISYIDARGGNISVRGIWGGSKNVVPAFGRGLVLSARDFRICTSPPMPW